MNKDLSTEELINIVKSSKPEEIGELFLSDVHQFILDSKFKSGDVKVKTSDIFLLYRKWCKKMDKVRKNKRDFFLEFGRFFQKGKTGSTRYYKLEKEINGQEENAQE